MHRSRPHSNWQRGLGTLNALLPVCCKDCGPGAPSLRKLVRYSILGDAAGKKEFLTPAFHNLHGSAESHLFADNFLFVVLMWSQTSRRADEKDLCDGRRCMWVVAGQTTGHGKIAGRHLYVEGFEYQYE